MADHQRPEIRTKRLLTTAEAAQELGVTKSYLEKLRVYGSGPVFVKLGRSVRYEQSALDSWISLGRRRSTSDEDGAA